MENLKFLDDLVNNIEDYYGIKVDDANSIKTRIYNSIITRHAYLPKYYEIRHKGQVVKGKLGNISISRLMAIREMYEKRKFTQEDWEQCLLPLSDKLFFCEMSQDIYENIDCSIGNYLVRHNCSDLMFRFASNTTLIPKLVGETVNIFDTFIKKESSINDKKHILSNEHILGDVDDDLWVLRYIEAIYTKDKAQTDIDLKDRTELNMLAESHNIVYEDLLFRVKTGMQVDDAISLGEQEHKQYGIKYSNVVNNTNFIEYLRYLANKEGKQ